MFETAEKLLKVRDKLIDLLDTDTKTIRSCIANLMIILTIVIINIIICVMGIMSNVIFVIGSLIVMIVLDMSGAIKDKINKIYCIFKSKI